MRKNSASLLAVFLVVVFLSNPWAACAPPAQTALQEFSPWTPVNPVPIPSASAQAAARQYFSRLFRLKYGRLDSNHTFEFMNSLFNKYVNSNHKHAARAYVALTLCWQLAARKGVPGMITAPAQALCRNYKVNRWRLLAKATRLALPNLQDRWSCQFLMKCSYRWGHEAIAAHAFTSARSLLAVAFRCARTVQNAWYLQVIPPRSRQLVMLQAAYKQHLADLAFLQQHPHNAETLARVAVYDWVMSRQPRAATLANAAAKSSGYHTLAKIARLNALKAPNATDEVQLGNLWWNLPKTHHVRAFAPLVRLRAVVIYRQAIGNVQTDFSRLLGADHYRQAIAFMTAARRAVHRIGDPRLQRLSEGFKSLLLQTRLMHRRDIAAMAVIAKRPGDPAANQVVGEYTCFLGGRWTTGLRYLRHSAVVGVRRAAKADLSDPHHPQRQIVLGNQWWTLARGYHGLMKINIQLRAVYWYRRALSQLPATGERIVRDRVARFKSSH
ncbi:MAG: hypothetical protein HKL95_05140 [Phycisphaerae bacterium]|nr:hypothetical protein [Phycisphaerae bacterium]